MIVKVVCAGDNHFFKLYQPDENELLIGVDGGAKVLLNHQLPINLAIGDFDSSSIDEIKEHSDKVITFPSHKDKSDLELTLNYLESLNGKIDEVIIYNATGNRLDHYQSVINLLVSYSHLPLKIIDNNNLISLISSKTTFTKSNYQYISFFAAEVDTVISLKGFIYELTDYHLQMYDSLCLSNEIKDQEAIIDINNKKVIVFQSN